MAKHDPLFEDADYLKALVDVARDDLKREEGERAAVRTLSNTVYGYLVAAGLLSFWMCSRTAEHYGPAFATYAQVAFGTLNLTCLAFALFALIRAARGGSYVVVKGMKSLLSTVRASQRQLAAINGRPAPHDGPSFPEPTEQAEADMMVYRHVLKQYLVKVSNATQRNTRRTYRRHRNVARAISHVEVAVVGLALQAFAYFIAWAFLFEAKHVK